MASKRESRLRPIQLVIQPSVDVFFFFHGMGEEIMVNQIGSLKTSPVVVWVCRILEGFGFRRRACR